MPYKPGSRALDPREITIQPGWEDRRRTSPATRAMMEDYIQRNYPAPDDHAIELQAELEDQAKFLEAYPFAGIIDEKPRWHLTNMQMFFIGTVLFWILAMIFR
jgi:hypothetical protein